jgi:threonine dehydrogenase-like Zn-dependent dehydrogenase
MKPNLARFGAKKVVVVERQKHRALFVSQFGADQVIVNPPRQEAETTDSYAERFSKSILEEVSDLNRGFDIVIEAAGSEECMNIGLRVARNNATCKLTVREIVVVRPNTYLDVQLGVYGDKSPPQIPMMVLMSKQVTIRSTSPSFRY